MHVSTYLKFLNNIYRLQNDKMIISVCKKRRKGKNIIFPIFQPIIVVLASKTFRNESIIVQMIIQCIHIIIVRDEIEMV